MFTPRRLMKAALLCALVLSPAVAAVAGASSSSVDETTAGGWSVGKRLALLKVVEGGEVAWRKWLRSPDVDNDYAFAAPALLVRPTRAGGYLLARDVKEGPKGWLGLKGADKGGFLLRRWDEGRADECFEDDDARVSLPDVKIERVKARLSAFPPETEARPAPGVTRETSIAPAPAPACLIEEKKKK